jgi:hypothetical protein
MQSVWRIRVERKVSTWVCLRYHGKVHKIFWRKETFVREKHYGAVRERARKEERKGREPARDWVTRERERAHCIARPK